MLQLDCDNSVQLRLGCNYLHTSSRRVVEFHSCQLTSQAGLHHPPVLLLQADDDGGDHPRGHVGSIPLRRCQWPDVLHRGDVIYVFGGIKNKKSMPNCMSIIKTSCAVRAYQTHNTNLAVNSAGLDYHRIIKELRQTRAYDNTI